MYKRQVFCQSFPVAAGISLNQFDLFLQKAEEQSAEVVSEIFNNGFLYGEKQESENEEDDEEDVEISSSSTDSSYTVH